MFYTDIAIFTIYHELIPKAEQLSKQLDLPFITNVDEKFAYLLVLTPNYIGLQKTGTNANPLYIDFLSGKMQFRRKQASLRNEILARALGLKNKSPRTILDATAGLARDSFILASLGFAIDLIERSPIIHLLIADGIERAVKNQEFASIMQKMHLIKTDAITWMKTHSYDIVYLDPMFPERKKSALSKQDMRIFHEIVGQDLDADQLLQAALTCAKQRVVVKRPRLAQPLANKSPTFSMEGSSNRFDIYLTRDIHGNPATTT